MLKDSDFHEADESDAGEVLGSDAQTSTPKAGSGGVSPGMTREEPLAKDKDMIVTSRKSDSDKKKIKQVLLEKLIMGTLEYWCLSLLT